MKSFENLHYCSGLNISAYYLSLLKAKERLRAAGFLMPHLIEIDKGKEPKEIFSIYFKNKFKISYDRDWKRLKE